jgi:hypothetical protein
MGKKKKTLADMPHLPLRTLEAIEALEDRLKLRLKRCEHDTQVYEYLRTYAVGIFDLLFLHYTDFPDLKPYWKEAAEEQAIMRVFAVYSGEFGTAWHPTSTYEKPLRQTIARHVEELAASKNHTSAPIEQQKPPAIRKRLFDEYRSQCPNAGILDICWAAAQHYREWSRWLNGTLKDGSKADRAFRQVFASGKEAKTLRREQRPKEWR